MTVCFKSKYSNIEITYLCNILKNKDILDCTKLHSILVHCLDVNQNIFEILYSKDCFPADPTTLP